MYLTARVWRGKGSDEICYFFTLTRFSFGILHTTTYFSYYVPSTPKCILWVYVRIHICYILLQKLYCVFKKYIFHSLISDDTQKRILSKIIYEIVYKNSLFPNSMEYLCYFSISFEKVTFFTEILT